jgi:hypothetical protein
MKIPKYWAKEIQSVTNPDGRAFALTCWQWSDVSQTEAAQRAKTRIQDVATKVQRNETLQRYTYGKRPMREEIIQAIQSRNGKEIGIVTRNGYGALVVNAANAMFIDIDFERKSPTGLLKGLMNKLLGKKSVSQEEQQVAQIELWAQTRPDLGIRVYRTFAGLRCLITNEVFAPTDAGALAILRDLNSDPLYITLCKQQECFRARLTPKPWRCNISTPPARYPFENQQVLSRYRQWERTYSANASQFTTCRFIKHIGRNQVHPEVQPILDFHDQRACGNPQLGLA